MHLTRYRSMSVLKHYLSLEKVLLGLDVDEPRADNIRDVMDYLWWQLTDDERKWLRSHARSADDDEWYDEPDTNPLTQPINVTTYYVRGGVDLRRWYQRCLYFLTRAKRWAPPGPAGSDRTGDGSADKPYKTFKKALSMIPDVAPAGRIVINLQDLRETFPPGYTIPQVGNKTDEE